MNTFQKLTLLITALLFTAAIPAIAQINQTVKFDAPFAFYAGNAELPAGSYTVTHPEDNADVLLLENDDRSQSAFVECRTVDTNSAPNDTEVAFNKYGKTDFLSRIWLQGESSAMEILPSMAEKTAARSSAAVQHSLSAEKVRAEGQMNTKAQR
jgi:hypothetical protein